MVFLHLIQYTLVGKCFFRAFISLRGFAVAVDIAQSSHNVLMRT